MSPPQGKENMSEITHVVSDVDDAGLALTRTLRFMLAMCDGKVCLFVCLIYIYECI